jgi:hypothetical protein
MKRSIVIVFAMASASLCLFPQGVTSAARAFLETKEKSGIEAALTWLTGLDVQRDIQYLYDEKDFLNIGKEMKSFGYVEEAARFFQKATELIPRSSVIWESLGTTHIRLLHKDEAIRCLQQAIDIDPKNGSAQEQLKMIDILVEGTRFETRAKMRFLPGENTGLQGSYLGQRPPGLKPELFAPGIVSVFGSNENTVTISPDGRELYFGKESGIWVCRWTESGWTAPQNTGWPGYEMWISPETGKMYYTGYEPGIWMMEQSGMIWGKPQKLVSNGMFSTLTRDETLYTTVISERGKPNVARYVKKDGKYITPEILGPEINSANGFDAHPNVAPDASFLLFDRQPPQGKGLYISFKGPDGAWSPAKPLGDEFNGSLSTFFPDGKYMFFMKNRDIYWVSAKIIETFREKEQSAAELLNPEEEPFT